MIKTGKKTKMGKNLQCREKNGKQQYYYYIHLAKYKSNIIEVMCSESHSVVSDFAIP